MELARVVTFDEVSTERIEELRQRIEGGEQPDGLDATEMLFLHDADSGGAISIIFFADEEGYQRGEEILDAMPAGDTPGLRTTVKRYEVAIRMTR